MSRKIKLLILLATRDVGSPFSWLPKEIIVEIFKWLIPTYELVGKFYYDCVPKLHLICNKYILISGYSYDIKKRIIVGENEFISIDYLQNFGKYCIYDVHTITYIINDKNIWQLNNVSDWKLAQILDDKIVLLSSFTGDNVVMYYLYNLTNSELIYIELPCDAKYVSINEKGILFYCKGGSEKLISMPRMFEIYQTFKLTFETTKKKLLPQIKTYKCNFTGGKPWGSKFYKFKKILITINGRHIMVWKEN